MPQDVARPVDKEWSMKDFGLVAVTLFSLLLTAFAVPAAGWFSSKAPASRPPQIHTARASDLTSDAAIRHRQGQPVHWRALVLQH
jgi:hypothetical protein